jgi:SAM-dependent methyltransferase
VGRFLRYHLRQNQYRWSRLFKPDVWGPVSPALLRKYGVAYQRGDLTRLPFPDAAFDVVTCVSVLEHMPVTVRVTGLREMARVLRPGGRLILTYDLADGDISESLVEASGCVPSEAVYFHASKLLYASNGSDVVGLRLDKP